MGFVRFVYYQLTEARTVPNTYPGSSQTKKKFKCLFKIYWNHLFISAPKSCHLSTIYPFCIQPSSKSFLLPKFCEHHPKQMSRKYDAAKRSYSKQLERSWSWNMWSGTRKVMQLKDNKVKKTGKNTNSWNCYRTQRADHKPWNACLERSHDAAWRQI